MIKNGSPKSRASVPLKHEKSRYGFRSLVPLQLKVHGVQKMDWFTEFWTYFER
jgi:hypothetical protein